MSKLFIGIVCAKANGLPELWNSTYQFMEDLTAWLQNDGYETWVFTDEVKPLHVDDIRTEIRSQNKKIQNDQTGSYGLYNREAIFIYFCGHGFIRGRAEYFWILNDGKYAHDDRIDVTNMRDVLDEYEPKYVRIFGDACGQVRDLNGGGSTLIPASMRGKEYYSPVDLDQFMAASKNATTLSNENGPVFSQFVRAGLLDGHEKAYDQRHFELTNEKIITNRSLKTFIKPRFEQRIKALEGIPRPWMMPAVGFPGEIYRADTDDPPSSCETATETNDQFAGISEEIHRSESGVEWRTSSGISWPGVVVRAQHRDFDFSDLIPEKGYREAVSFPDPLRENEELAAFSWGGTDDNLNGTAILKLGGFTFFAPEFQGFTTVLAVKKSDEEDTSIRITGVLPLDDEPRVQTYGGVLLDTILDGDKDPEQILLLANYAANRAGEDPLVAVAMAYVLDACGRRDALLDLYSSMAITEAFEIAMDVPLLAGLPIEYDPEKRCLICQGRKLATQLPILSRGWSRLFRVTSTSIFSGLSDLKAAISSNGYAVFPSENNHNFLADWIGNYFIYERQPQLLQ